MRIVIPTISHHQESTFRAVCVASPSHRYAESVGPAHEQELELTVQHKIYDEKANNQ
jgi:hypothetical protein